MSRAYEKALFLAASGLEEPADRQALLDGACEGDPDLRNRIDKLFKLQSDADSYFDSRPGKASVGDSDRGDGREELDTTLGHYRLIDRLGEGGHGVVYLAEQDEPVRRKVALKIIRLGMDTEQVIARFEAERQSLAMMDHPNIARVLDAGSTATGRPFFVMELVDGERITDFCDTLHLGLRKRLEIFVQVCLAIQHAHQKGVIHRDIKPSNILVRMQDGVPVPKIIDFGIAKAAARGTEDNPTLTLPDQFLGTPAYMSPEVAAGSLDLDTRCDIHSLGAVLFELLTGQPPLGGERVKSLGIDEIRKILRDEDPPVPSAFLASMNPEELQATASNRNIEAQRLVQRIKGDLDWIVLRAMARERERRYESAYGFSLDVQRHLNDEPVSAGPPDPFYRLAKLVRRNKAPFLSGALGFLALVAGFSTSTVLFLREREALSEQQRLRKEAEAAKDAERDLRQLAEFRERISHAAVQVSHGEFEAADELVQSVPFNQAPASLEAADAYRELGNWHMTAKPRPHWQEATDYFANLALILPKVDTADSFDISVLVIPAAALLCRSEDYERYEVIRQWTIKRFSGTSSPVVAEQVFKTTLLHPPDEETLAALQPLASFLEKALTEGHPELDSANPDEWWSKFRSSWCSFALALMRYREGNLEAADHWYEQAVPIAGGHVPRETDLRCLGAMIRFRQGDVATARKMLDEARQPIDAYFSKPIELGGVSDYWYDWVIARLLYQEARDLVGG